MLPKIVFFDLCYPFGSEFFALVAMVLLRPAVELMVDLRKQIAEERSCWLAVGVVGCDIVNKDRWAGCG